MQSKIATYLNNYFFDEAKMKLFKLTIRIFEKFNKPSGVKSGVPSSIKDKSVRYIPRYGCWLFKISKTNLVFYLC